MSDTVKIAIISKECHAKELYAALKKEGYDPNHLGPDPAAIPPTTDVLICRDRSCSSEARKMSIAWGKRTGQPMIMQNGLTGIMRGLKKELAQTPKTKKPKASTFVLDTERLDELLEIAPGRNMSWLANVLGTNTDTLMPALMEAGRFTEVSATLNMAPIVPEIVVENPIEVRVADNDPNGAPSPDTLKGWVETVQNERSGDPIEIQMAVLRHLAGGTLSDDVLREALNPSMECDPMAPTPVNMPDISTAPAEGTEWRSAVPIHRLEEFVPIGVQLAEGWGSRDRERVKETFLNRDAKSHREFADTKGIPKKYHELFQSVEGKPLAFIAAIMWILPDGVEVTKRSFEAAYREIFDKGMDTRMVSAIAWAMGMPIRTAFRKKETPAPTPQKVAVAPTPPAIGATTTAPTPEAASGVLEALEALRSEVLALRTELAELKSPRASVTLNDLMAAGATISITPREES